MSPREMLWRTVCALCVVLMGCNVLAGPEYVAPVERETDALFQTDSLQYTMRAEGNSYQVAIGTTLTNPFDRAVAFVNCGGATGFHLQRLEGGTWRTVWTPIQPACLSDPLLVAAASTRRMSVFIYATQSVPFQRLDVPEIAGVYRVVWTAMVTSYRPLPPWGDSIPLAQRVSNSFTLAPP